VQIKVKCDLLLEGFRPKRVVRFYTATWKVIALPHADLLALANESQHSLSDPWCMKIAAGHLCHMIESGEDLEKTLVTLSPSELRAAAGL